MGLMFKSYKANKNATFNKNNRDLHASDSTSHRTGKQKNLILTNILEETNSVIDEPRSFEQDDQYLDECLKALDRNPQDFQDGDIDLEEYDFDDYNSIASTASLFNIHAESALDENNFTASSHAPLPSSDNTALWRSQPKNTQAKQADKSQAQLKEQLLRISKVQASISKVRDWSKANGTLNKDDWKDVLLEAAYQGDLKRLQEAYSKLGGTSELAIRITDAFANTAFHKAAEAGSVSTLQWLVGHLPNDCLRNITNGENLTPLAVAVKHGSVRCVEWLLEKTSASNEMTSNASRSALIHEAIQNGHEECLRCLLAYTRDNCLELDVTDLSGVTLAHIAAREGHMTCLQALVDHNIDVTSEDRDGRSPADYAYTAGQTSCGRYLVMEESCWLLSLRVAKLHRELKECKDENKELRQKLEVLESRARSGMLPDRPEVVGGDQSDTSGNGESKSFDDRLGSKISDMRHSDTIRASGSPDGESLNGFISERSLHQSYVNELHHKPLLSKTTSQLEASKQRKRLDTRESVDSIGSNVSSPMSDSSADNASMQLVMAKQIAANTRRLVMSKHAQKVEEAPLIRTRLNPDASIGVFADESVEKGSSTPMVQPDTSTSPSSSRSQSPLQTNNSRKDSNKLKRSNATASTYEKRTANDGRAGTLFRIRRKTPAISSDSTISSDSDSELNMQRSNGPRSRRGYTASHRTKEDSDGNLKVQRQNVAENAFSEKKKTNKTVSWKETPTKSAQTDQRKEIFNEKPRVPPKPPVRTVSRDSRAVRAGSRRDDAKWTYMPETMISRDRKPQTIRMSESGRERTVLPDTGLSVHRLIPKNSPRDGLDIYATTPVKRPVIIIEENSNSGSQLQYSLGDYQQDDRPWYETDDFD